MAVGFLSDAERLRWAAAIVVAASVWSSVMAALTDAAAHAFTDALGTIFLVAAGGPHFVVDRGQAGCQFVLNRSVHVR